MGGNDDTHDLKKKFLVAFRERKVVADALSAIGRSRDTFRKWRQEDKEFNTAYEDCDQDIIDDAKRLAYKKTGILPMTKEDRENGAHKWADNSLLQLILKRDPAFRDGVQVNVNSPMALPVKGLDASALGALIAPDGSQTKEPEMTVSMSVPKPPKALPLILQKLQPVKEDTTTEGTA